MAIYKIILGWVHLDLLMQVIMAMFSLKEMEILVMYLSQMLILLDG